MPPRSPHIDGSVRTSPSGVIASARPGISRSSSARVASGVRSVGVRPVPPVVSTTLAPAETAASIGGNQNTAEGMAALGQEINANHLRPKSEGLLRAVAVPVHLGRRTQVWSVEVRDEAEKLICIARCTLAVVEVSGRVPSFATGA